MKLYHSTTESAARAILRGGFRDAAGSYMMGVEVSGVWVPNVSLDWNEGACITVTERTAA
jgi:hypothetical protein